jgi:hypothetical protein
VGRLSAGALFDGSAEEKRSFVTSAVAILAPLIVFLAFKQILSP